MALMKASCHWTLFCRTVGLLPLRWNRSLTASAGKQPAYNKHNSISLYDSRNDMSCSERVEPTSTKLYIDSFHIKNNNSSNNNNDVICKHRDLSATAELLVPVAVAERPRDASCH